ncbi:Signal recognition particle subunit [Wickerhamomyces ciferrii]|uniref:Signal recognition particle subunit n=1 Tax=Wickerhamomyces ciferrii (strain ATCC 14091 / BCRC 22168 / CBS 111 / JCM 3599 / NBRC 0793 / NRRL Y-1031 F-60-10) TaxID=1206466 RepID=K0KQJ7_WICCF|nr:Signal recognition particle subunit [Wickerhamomyces ciferrii]CCH45316.1 Signal recognition particle subunit [Wickerhamomyces ciferrii]
MPLLEEISDAEDIDNMDMDLAEFDPSLRTPLAPKLEKKVVRSQDSEPQEPSLFPNFGNQGSLDDIDDDAGIRFENQKQFNDEELAQLKTLQLIYPCYFDKNRSHKEGRRVSKELAVENPLAKTIADACVSLHLVAVYEPEKTHPQDFGNPGRIRVALKHEGKPESILVNNKRHLFNQIAKYLKQHETTLQTIKSLPKPQEMAGFEPKEIPRVKGFKMNTIVPAFSRYTLGHPMTNSIYTEAPPQPVEDVKPVMPKQPKQKFMHVRR